MKPPTGSGWPARLSFIGCLTLVVAFTLTFSMLNWQRVASGGADLDLGIVSQVLWNTTHGDFLYSSGPGLFAPMLKEHCNPVYWPMAALYALYPDPRLLTLLQVLVLAAALVPLWFLAQHCCGPLPALLITAAAAASPTLQYIALSEFHPVTLALPVLLAALYARARQHPRLAFLLFCSCLLIDEALAVTIAAVGLFDLVRARMRSGLALVGIGALAYLLIVFCVLPAFTPSGVPLYFYHSYFRYIPGTSGIDKIIAVCHNPGLFGPQAVNSRTADYLFMLFLPLAGLPFAAPALIIPALPQLAFNVLSGFAGTAAIHQHYNALTLAFLFPAAILGIRRLARRLRCGRLHLPTIAAAFMLAATLAAHRFDSPLPWLTTRHFYPAGYDDAARFSQAVPLLRLIPATASVGTEFKYWSYLSHRHDLYLLNHPHPAADYYLFDTLSTLPMAQQPGTVNEYLAGLLNTRAYRICAARDGIILLCRNPLP